MKFKKLDITGFKSFSDKTTFLIEEGLTGIVGPNGCGKSNIVESLRWCMGENSAKSMRGSGMEDVIFSGTSNKTSKNIAEVSVYVANKNNEGPVQFRELNEINVRRKMHRKIAYSYPFKDNEVRFTNSTNNISFYDGVVVLEKQEMTRAKEIRTDIKEAK